MIEKMTDSNKKRKKIVQQSETYSNFVKGDDLKYVESQ